IPRGGTARELGWSSGQVRPDLLHARLRRPPCGPSPSAMVPRIAVRYIAAFVYPRAASSLVSSVRVCRLTGGTPRPARGSRAPGGPPAVGPSAQPASRGGVGLARLDTPGGPAQHPLSGHGIRQAVTARERAMNAGVVGGRLKADRLDEAVDAFRHEAIPALT